MFTPQEKACCVLLLAEQKLVITAECALRHEFNKDHPHENNIRQWFHQFEETGSILKQIRMGRLKTSDEVVEDIRQSCVCRPRKFLCCHSLQLQVTKSKLYGVL
jgi:hypothetical protein